MKKRFPMLYNFWLENLCRLENLKFTFNFCIPIHQDVVEMYCHDLLTAKKDSGELSLAINSITLFLKGKPYEQKWNFKKRLMNLISKKTSSNAPSTLILKLLITLA